ncbi:hypothetical protein [Prosthecobacter sp.]|uniref:hypothetical protein n=1 Tax=Prosthecobacter sp. TaxID=1965333 RepID=UPI00378498DF
MKLSPFALLAIAMCGGTLQALAQGGFTQPREEAAKANRGGFTSAPPFKQSPVDVLRAPGSAEEEKLENAMLSVNYRIVITATQNGTRLGELMTLTCASAFQMNGAMDKRSSDEPTGATLSVRGALTEQEGGTLKLSYVMRAEVAVPMQTMGVPGGPAVWSTHAYKHTGATGMLLLKPGQDYEVMTVSGIAYAISITPTETPPAPRPQPRKNPRGAAEDAAAQPAEGPRRERLPLSDAEREAESAEGRKDYEALSDDAKERFREAMTETFRDEKFRNAPTEERRETIKKLFEKIKAEDKATPGRKAAETHATPAPPAAAPLPETKRPSPESRHGPTDEDRRRFESLSEKAREKFRDSMRETFIDEKFRNAPEEERRAKIRQLFEKAEAEDKAGKEQR